MIIQKTIQVKVVPTTLNYWKSKNYTCSVGEVITVETLDLSTNSNVRVECVCDKCFQKYAQRFSRNTSVCGKCIVQSKMKGNTLGSKNTKHKIPDKQELLDLIQVSQFGKAKIAEKYGVSISVVNGWVDKYDISLNSYHGRKYFKSDESRESTILKLQKKIRETHEIGISELSRITGVPAHIVHLLVKDGSLKVQTMQDIWSEKYDEILNNMPVFLSENDTKDLKTIAQESNISLEQLKKAFRETGNPVKLHGYNKSSGELQCKEFIESLGFSCHSQKFEKKYEIDCFVESRNFGVEYCGEYWHRHTAGDRQSKYRHRNKSEYFRSKSINILTIFENEWTDKNDIVKSMIRSRLGLNKVIFARKCEIIHITKREAERFHEDNHLSGSCNSSVNIGLMYDGILVSVLSFVKSRFCKDYEYEISRFSTLLGHTVTGGLSRMFAFFVRTYEPKSCMTYADLRVGEGKSYENIGFQFLGKTPPNYFYYNKKTKQVESRMKYQKHKLKHFASYSENLTEHQIMDKEGFSYRVYDCGNNKFGWKLDEI